MIAALDWSALSPLDQRLARAVDATLATRALKPLDWVLLLEEQILLEEVDLEAKPESTVPVGVR